MRTKIKDEWVDYDYALGTSHSNIERVVEWLKQSKGIDYKYIGKSKVIIGKYGKVTQLKKRFLFFKKM